MLTIDLSSGLFLDKVRGCWVGKNCGGTLGTPIEEAWGRAEPFDVWWYPVLADGGLPNDDLEMQLIWLTALEQVGSGLKARDLAGYWLDHIGYNWDEYGMSKANLRLGLVPPLSGGFNNWFVDCMGCPIRSEIWACVAPGVPRLAARLAYEDAVCDHAGGESVFGEMFNAAVQSAAFVVSDRRRLIDIALSYLPEHSATARAVRTAVAAYEDGCSWQESRARVLAEVPHHVAQYSPINLGFQTIGFLDGKDFGDVLCKTVNCGYDTDSSTGSVGSWYGILVGSAGLDPRWTAPFGESISTNESWGGVRHLEGVPTTLGEVVSRVAAAARRMLTDEGLLDGDTLIVAEDSLLADDTVRELWDRDPLRVAYDAGQVTVGIRYPNGPVTVAGQDSVIEVEVGNPHPDALRVRLSVLPPTAWPVSEPVTIELPPQGSSSTTIAIPTPERRQIKPSNRLFLDVQVLGRPQDPALPVVLIGAAVLRTSGPYAGAAGASERGLLDTQFPPETDTAPGAWLPDSRPGVWVEHFGVGNALPEEALEWESGVLYAQCFLESPDARSVQIGVESSCPFRAWVNGVQVLDECRHRPIRPAFHATPDGSLAVDLRTGWNELLIKFARQAGSPPAQCHVLLSEPGRLAAGIVDISRTRLAWD